jgi:hypothetical protein
LGKEEALAAAQGEGGFGGVVNCRMNAAFRLGSERRIYGAAKSFVVRLQMQLRGRGCIEGVDGEGGSLQFGHPLLDHQPGGLDIQQVVSSGVLA